MSGTENLTNEELLERVSAAMSADRRVVAKFYAVSFLTRTGGDPERLRTMSARDLCAEIVCYQEAASPADPFEGIAP